MILTGMLVAVAVASLSACGGAAATDALPTATVAVAPPQVAPTETMDESMAATPPGSDAVATPAQTSGMQDAGSTVEIQGTLKEWAITLSQSEVPAGKVKFTVTNEGEMMHNFTVTDSSGVIGATPNFAGGQGAQTLELDLKPGTYTIICSLPGHAARGQKTELVVK